MEKWKRDLDKYLLSGDPQENEQEHEIDPEDLDDGFVPESEEEGDDDLEDYDDDEEDDEDEGEETPV